MPLPIANFVEKSITTLTKADAKIPIVGAEACVITGRTHAAQKRGGKTEARERVIEESTGAVVWLWGVDWLNKIGDKIIDKTLSNNGKGVNVDVGEDALRKPFQNFIKSNEFNPNKISAKKLSMLKFGKVATSILIANGIMGFVVPPLNHKLTDYYAKKDKEKNTPTTNNKPNKTPQAQPVNRFENFKKDALNNKSNPSFKGGINTFTNFIENTNTGQLLSTDVGVLGGRVYNSRRKEEKIEAGFRDGASIYFYMWAQPHTRALLNKIETGRWDRLDPSSVNIVNQHIESALLENGQISVEEFKRKAFANENIHVDVDRFMQGKEAITLEQFKAVESSPEIQQRALKMSTLQPKQLDVSVLSKDQVIGIYQKGEINNPELLKPAYECFTNGNSSNPNKYVKNSKLVGLKKRMADYMSDICKAGEKNNGVIDKALLQKMKHKNLMFNGLNFLVGFGVAVTFLSHVIPKVQYAITKRMTGVDAFPGVYDYKNPTQNLNTAKKSK